MSSTLPTLPRPERPPFRGGPPIKTTFDGWFSGDSDPEFEVLLSSAEALLRTVDSTPDDELDLLMRLLKQRERWILEQLTSAELLNPVSLPPIYGFSISDLLEVRDPVSVRLGRVLNRLSDAMIKVKMRMDLRECPFPLPDL